jgi:hypothetical protein
MSLIKIWASHAGARLHMGAQEGPNSNEAAESEEVSETVIPILSYISLSVLQARVTQHHQLTNHKLKADELWTNDTLACKTR